MDFFLNEIDDYRNASIHNRLAFVQRFFDYEYRANENIIEWEERRDTEESIRQWAHFLIDRATKGNTEGRQLERALEDMVDNNMQELWEELVKLADDMEDDLIAFLKSIEAMKTANDMS